ncbi:MAG: elongation factor P [Spirochaetes bacterium]|nr:elongation factor P [Spirochaetota bacterium]
MASISEFRKGMAIKFNNDVWIITEFQHVTPGNWRAMVRTKLKNAKTGRVLENTFRMTDSIEEIRLEEKEMQYIYESDGDLYFMDTESYDQIFIPTALLGNQKRFLREGDMCRIMFMEGNAISAELPLSLNIKVAEAEPGLKGASVTNIMKNAVLETGAKVQVPIFINAGDVLKIDTRTGKYMERISRG